MVHYLWLRRAAKRARAHLASIPPDQLGPAAKLLRPVNADRIDSLGLHDNGEPPR